MPDQALQNGEFRSAFGMSRGGRRDHIQKKFVAPVEYLYNCQWMRMQIRGVEGGDFAPLSRHSLSPG